MVTNPGIQIARRVRLREVQRLMLDGRQTAEIFDELGELHSVTYETIKNDVSDINKSQRDSIDEATELKGNADYMARTFELRLKAKEDGDLKLVHILNQELARMFGVNLKIDDKNFRLTLDRAIEHMDKVIQAVFSVVHDSDTQDRVIEAIDAIAEE